MIEPEVLLTFSVFLSELLPLIYLQYDVTVIEVTFDYKAFLVKRSAVERFECDFFKSFTNP